MLLPVTLVHSVTMPGTQMVIPLPRPSVPLGCRGKPEVRAAKICSLVFRVTLNPFPIISFVMMTYLSGIFWKN